MNKVILSTDSNHEYYQLLPLVCYSWRKIGYQPIVYVVGNIPKVVSDYSDAVFINVQSVKGVKDSTIAQLWRLFAWQYSNPDDILVTGDADMVIAKDIFTHDVSNNQIVSYGFDLTGFSELPMCYVKAKSSMWRELIPNIEIPLDALNENWERYWVCDQQFLTNSAKEYGFDKITFVDRGHDNLNEGLPMGRWDRYKWGNVPKDIIDVHMKRNSFDAQIQVFKHLFPNDDYSFLLNFINETK